MDGNKLTRREFIRMGGLAGIGLVAAACGTPQVVEQEVTREVTRVVEPTATPAPQAGLRRGGQLIHATSYSVDTFDAHSSFTAHVAFMTSAYNYLVRYTMLNSEPVEFGLVGELAESWGYDDPQTVVFDLRKGVKFHDGSDFNAKVAKWNIERMISYDSSLMKSWLAAVDGAEAPDDSTLVVRLSKPYGLLPTALSSGVGYGRSAMLSQATVEQSGDEAYDQEPMGTGPFKLKERIGDDRVIMEPFEDYWETGEDGKPLPYLDELVIRYIPDLTVATAELAAGTVHTVQEMPPSQYQAVRAVEHLEGELWTWIGLSIITGAINHRFPPFDDIRVRKALNFGMDRKGLAEAVLFGLGLPAALPNGAGPSAEGWSEEAEHMYDFDPDKAKALLAEAGYADGIDTSMKSIFREPDNSATQYITEMWKQSNIRCEPMPLERTVWIDEVARENEFELSFARYPLAGISPFFFRPNWTCDGSNNYGGYCDPVVDDLIAQGEGESDDAKRNEIARELYVHTMEQAHHFNGARLPHIFVRNVQAHGIVPDWSWPNMNAAWLSEV